MSIIASHTGRVRAYQIASVSMFGCQPKKAIREASHLPEGKSTDVDDAPAPAVKSKCY